LIGEGFDPIMIVNPPEPFEIDQPPHSIRHNSNHWYRLLLKL